MTAAMCETAATRSAVVAGLQSLGFDAFDEHPGVVTIRVGPFAVSTGLHGWDYGSVHVLFPSADELHGVAGEPYDSAEVVAACGPCEADPAWIAHAWADAVRSFAAGEHVRPALVPERRNAHA
jgi:hypothetical protein